MVNPILLAKLAELFSDTTMGSLCKLAQFLPWDDFEHYLTEAEACTNPVASWFEEILIENNKDVSAVSESMFQGVFYSFLMALMKEEAAPTESLDWSKPEVQESLQRPKTNMFEKLDEAWVTQLIVGDREGFVAAAAVSAEIENVGHALRYFRLFTRVQDEVKLAVGRRTQRSEQLITGQERPFNERLLDLVFGPSSDDIGNDIDLTIIWFRMPVIGLPINS